LNCSQSLRPKLCRHICTTCQYCETYNTTSRYIT
jgi:hypothetical protein